MRTQNLCHRRLWRWWPVLGLVLILGLVAGADAQEKKDKFFKKGPPDFKAQPGQRDDRGSTDQVRRLEDEVARLREQVRALSTQHGGQARAEHQGPWHHGMADKGSSWHGHGRFAAHHGPWHHWARTSERGHYAAAGQHGEHCRHHAYHHGHHGAHWTHARHGAAGGHNVQRELDRIQHDLDELRHSLHATQFTSWSHRQ